MQMRLNLSTIFLTCALGGCVGPLVPVVEIDGVTAQNLRREVRIYPGGDLPTGSKYLGPITATSCMNKIWDRPATSEDAINQLLYKSRLMGGNAVNSLLCEGTEGTNLAKNCWNSVTCHAVALRVAPDSRSSSPDANNDRKAGSSSATGFFINEDGLIITAAHAVKRCQTLSVVIKGSVLPVNLLRRDAVNDLALLQLSGDSPYYLKFRSGKRLRAGDGIVSVGYPLRGILADEANITSGVVSALAGLGNDSRYIQITSPVQPGNSGGPLLDRSGLLVGVVIAKLDALRLAKISGDIPQNVNFAIRGRVVQAFIEANDVFFEQARPGEEISVADIGDVAKKATIPILCRR